MHSASDPSGAIIAGLFLFYGFIILLSLASSVFWVVEIIDVARREFRDSNTKLLWLLVVILAHGLGALIYYFAGKPQGWLPGEAPLYTAQTPPAYYPPQTPSGQYPPPPAYYPPSDTEHRQE